MAVKVDIVVPNVGEAVSEVTLVGWKKEPGQEVKAGEPLFVIDTDKAQLEVEATNDGTLVEVRVQAGAGVVPLDVIGVLDVAER